MFSENSVSLWKKGNPIAAMSREMIFKILGQVIEDLSVGSGRKGTNNCQGLWIRNVYWYQDAQ